MSVEHIEPRTVVLSGASDDNPNLVTDVLANHGTGFILKGTKAKVFEHALAMTVDGGVFIPEEILRAIAPRSMTSRARVGRCAASTEPHAQRNRDRGSAHPGHDVQEDRAGARAATQAKHFGEHSADACGQHGVEARRHNERESGRDGGNRADEDSSSRSTTAIGQPRSTEDQNSISRALRSSCRFISSRIAATATGL